MSNCSNNICWKHSLSIVELPLQFCQKSVGHVPVVQFRWLIWWPGERALPNIYCYRYDRHKQFICQLQGRGRMKRWQINYSCSGSHRGTDGSSRSPSILKLRNRKPWTNWRAELSWYAQTVKDLLCDIEWFCICDLF